MNPSPDSRGAVLDRKGIAALLLLIAAVCGVCWWDRDQTPAGPADLEVRSVSIDGLRYSYQLLTAEGVVSATVRNPGKTPIGRPFQVVFFEDTDGNGAYGAGTDALLGTTTCSQPLASGAETVVTAEIRGTVRFPKNLVWAWIEPPRSIVAREDRTNCAHSGNNCLAEPLVGKFEPEPKWHKSEFSVEPDSRNVTMTPAVIDLDGDGYPEIVFSTFTGGAYTAGGCLRAVRGTTGDELWTATSPRVKPCCGVAVGDIDDDGRPEIVAVDESDKLIAFEHDGTYKWTSEAIWGRIGWGSPSLADLDHDGAPEVVIGATVVGGDGKTRWEGKVAGGIGRGSNGNIGPLSAVADLDLDGNPEIAAGCSAYRADGKLYWNSTISDGFPALGNFDDDPYPEIVVVSGGLVYLLEHTGEVKVPGRERLPWPHESTSPLTMRGVTRRCCLMNEIGRCSFSCWTDPARLTSRMTQPALGERITWPPY
jgi:hypothetical protein